MALLPAGCSASPSSDDNLFVWTATVFGPDGKAFREASACQAHSLSWSACPKVAASPEHAASVVCVSALTILSLLSQTRHGKAASSA